MKEQLDSAKAMLAAMENSEMTDRARAWDKRAGRIVGAARAFGWSLLAVFTGAFGAAVCTHFDGPIRGGLTMVVGTIIIFAVWRAYRGLCFPPTATDLVRDEIESRLMKVETVLNVVNRVRGQRAG